MADEDQTRIVQFCSQCFATDENGSWGGSVFEHYCTNCGSGGTAVPMPKHAADSIRRQASWVGKRYYPCDEDVELQDELVRLRKTMTMYPGRTVAKAQSDPEYWVVTQKKPGGKSVSCMFKASCAQEALTFSMTRMPYYSEEDLA